MDTLQAIERRLSSVHDLHSIVRTMKALAAVNIAQFEKAARSVDEYAETVELALMAVLRRPDGRVAARPSRPGPLGGVVFGSDQGMCGQLNEDLTGLVLETLARESDRPSSLLVVGERAADRLRDMDLDIGHVFRVPTGVGGFLPLVQRLSVELQAWTEFLGLEEIRLFHPVPVGQASSHPTTTRLLPLDDQWLKTLQARPWPGRSLPLCTMSQGNLFSSLVREYMFVGLYRALAQSLASENAMRLAAMQGAERNIRERLEALTRDFHTTRQAGITEELLDIVAGFESLA
ncbi:MAG: F0F1 ATP synthase subunit gamma [Deltaproteobacteria bacterium]|nr:F0F1 ATP synthase subunit gamma [Deltaproteobacteria bacterium]